MTIQEAIDKVSAIIDSIKRREEITLDEWDGEAIHMAMNALKKVQHLQQALADAGLSWEYETCGCCRMQYIPTNSDSVRCNGCCISCYRKGGEWIKGSQCPSTRKSK